MSEIADRIRDQRQHWAAPGSNHDTVIKAARVLLPAGIGVLTAFLAMAPLTMGGDLSFVLAKDRVEVARERMRATDALYRGADSEGQPFALSAASAVQLSSADPVVRLHDLAARIALQDGPAVLRANQGRYNMETERVAIDGPLLFESADGYRLATSDVTVDLPSRQLASDGDVKGRMPLGTFSANSMRADLEARTVTLEGRVRLHIVQEAAQ